MSGIIKYDANTASLIKEIANELDSEFEFAIEELVMDEYLIQVGNFNYLIDGLKINKLILDMKKGIFEFDCEIKSVKAEDPNNVIKNLIIENMISSL